MPVNMFTNYRSTDDEKSALTLEVEQHCTFRPKVAAGSPFASERTLRILSESQRLANKTPSKIRSTSKKSTGKDRKLGKTSSAPKNGGIFTHANGFQPGTSCQPGMNYYFYNTEHPPDFRGGTSLAFVTVAGAAITTEETTEEAQSLTSNSLEAPPLPPWATGGAKPSVPEKKPLVFKRGESTAKSKEPAPVTGWQAIMAEMERRKNGGLKKVEPVAAAPPKPAPKAKRKKGEKKPFKDVMEELNYKLAKLRGEVPESDGEEEEEEVASITANSSAQVSEAATPVNVPSIASDSPVTIASSAIPKVDSIDSNAAGIAARTVTMSPAVPVDASPGPSSTPKTMRKLQSKPDLSSLLAKMKPPTAPAASPRTGLPPPSPAVDAPSVSAPSSNSDGSTDLGKPATPPVTDYPFPPPVPREWPPAVYIAPASTSSSSSSSSSSVASTGTGAATGLPPRPPTTTTKAVVTTQQAPVAQLMPVKLPEGYLLPQPMHGMVQGGQIVLGGVASQEMCDNMNTGSSSSSVADGFDDETLSVHSIDLASERERDEAAETAAELTRRKLLTINDLPVPTYFHAAVERLHRSQELRNAKREREKSLQLRSYCEYSTEISAPPDLGRDRATTAHHSNTRPEVTRPIEPVFNVDKRAESKVHTFRKSSSTLGDMNRTQPMCPSFDAPINPLNAPIYREVTADIPSAVWISELRSGYDSPSMKNRMGNTFNSFGTPRKDNNDGGGVGLGDTGSQMSQSTYSRPPLTEPKEPKFRSDRLCERRGQAHAERQAAKQAAKEEEERQAKYAKEQLRLKALQAAQEAGVYRAPTNRLHQHEKMVAKYGTNPHVGIDLKRVTRLTTAEYSSKHLLSSPHRNPHQQQQQQQYMASSPVATAGSSQQQMYNNNYHQAPQSPSPRMVQTVDGPYRQQQQPPPPQQQFPSQAQYHPSIQKDSQRRGAYGLLESALHSPGPGSAQADKHQQRGYRNRSPDQNSNPRNALYPQSQQQSQQQRVRRGAQQSDLQNYDDANRFGYSF